MEDLVKKVRRYADEPAYPSLAQDPWGKGYMAGGLTKRELFAAMAMQGLLAALGDDLTRAAASDATSYADALIAALSAGEKA